MPNLTPYLYAALAALGVGAVGMALGLVPATWLPKAIQGVLQQGWKAVRGVWAGLQRLARGWWDALSTDMQARYAQHWVMLLGEQQSGKTSLVLSLRAVQHGDQDISLTRTGMPRAQWWPIDKAWVIDLDGGVSANATTTGQAQPWLDHLDALCELRPDRALDAVILTLRLGSLLDTQKRLACAQLARRQLHDLRERCAISVPVYLVLTQADQWPGFCDYWQALPEPLRQQMVGWSVPSSLADAAPASWVDSALADLNQSLHDLLLHAPSLRAPLAQPDQALLFMEAFRALRQPLRDYLVQVFADDTATLPLGLRGFYVAGALTGQAAQDPRADLSFVEDLIHRKLLSEPGLARSTATSWWSRSATLRSWQASVVALCLGLAALVAQQLWQASTSVDRLALAQLQIRQALAAMPLQTPCTSGSQLDSLLVQTPALQTNLGLLEIWDTQPQNGVSDFVARELLESQVLPAMHCELQQRVAQLNEQLLQQRTGLAQPKSAFSLSAPYSPYESVRARLVQDMAAVSNLEQQLQSYQLILTRRADPASQQIVWLGQLHQYLYDKPLPGASGKANGPLALALTRVQVNRLRPALTRASSLGLSAQRRSQWMSVLTEQVEQTAQALSAEVGRGPELFSTVDQSVRSTRQPASAQVPLEIQAQNLYHWLNWVQTRWLGANASSNPCAADAVQFGAMQALFSPGLYEDRPAPTDAKANPVKDPGQRALAGALTGFDPEHCTQPAQSQLQAMELPVYGPVADRSTGLLNPKLVKEAAGLQALLTLPAMQSVELREFGCNTGANRWSATLTSQAQDRVRQYQGLPPAPTGPALALYDRIARYQLVRSVADLLARAQSQEPAPNPSQTATDSALADQQVLATSVDFAHAAESLLSTLRGLNQLPYKSAFEAARFSSMVQCSRAYAGTALGQVRSLAVQSQLYQPKVDTQTSTMLNLSPADVASNYLNRQLARAQVLTGYADPFVAWLRNTDALNDSHLADQVSYAYWNQTINEITRYTQYNDDSGQVGTLHSLIGQTLISMSFDNCQKILNGYDAGKTGDDLFSQQRLSLLQSLRLACNDRQSAQANQLFEQWAGRFNTELAGGYPFASADAPEARLATVRAFFVDYDAQRANLADKVRPLKGPHWDQVRAFLTRLDAVNELLRATLAATPAPAAVQLQWNLRPLRQAGQGQIVSWALSSGDRVLNYPGESAQNVEWPFGQVLTLDIKWAESSPYRPVAKSQRSDYSVDGATASFTAAGDWALIRWLQRHAAKSVASKNKLDPTQQWLEFVVPVQRPVPSKTAAPGQAVTPVSTERSVLTLSLRMSAIDPQTKAPVPLPWPVQFPCQAPAATTTATRSNCHEP